MSEQTRELGPGGADEEVLDARRPQAWRVVALPGPSDWSSYLDGVAAALGIKSPSGRQLRFKVNGTPVKVAVTSDEDGLTSFTVTVSFEGHHEGPAPTILLRGEDEGDLEGKRLGIAREVQTGFEDFDRAVYIDNERRTPTCSASSRRRPRGRPCRTCSSTAGAGS